MAARSVPRLPAQKALRVAGILDVVLGIAMAVFGESFVPMGEVVPGFLLWRLVGGLLAAAGLGVLIFAASLQRRNTATPLPDDEPVRR